MLKNVSGSAIHGEGLTSRRVSFDLLSLQNRFRVERSILGSAAVPVRLAGLKPRPSETLWVNLFHTLARMC